MRRRALVASYYAPQFDRDCASQRVFGFIDYLRGAGWDVDFVAANGTGPLSYVHALQRTGVAVHDDSVTTDGPSPFERLVQSSHFDLALLVFWPVARFYIPRLRRLSPATRILVSSEDVHFLREARRLLQAPSRGDSTTSLDGEFAGQLVEELNTYLAADAVIAVSQKEADFLGELAGRRLNLHVVPLSDDIPPSTVALGERRGALMLGSYQHPPNIDAVDHLFHDILPHVDPVLLERHPIDIVGNGLDRGVMQLATGIDSVRLVGWVPSVTPYFHRARVSLVPLRYGAGTKGKMVQALMSLTPTVCTSIGAEGLGLEHGKHVLIADNPKTFAAAIERLLTDDELWLDLATAGRAWALRSHTREVVRESFLETVRATLSSPSLPITLREESAREYSQRIFPQYKAKAVPALSRLAQAEAPGAAVLVASNGDDGFLDLGETSAWHFPQGEEGAFVDPSSFASVELVAHLEELRRRGAGLLIIPLHTKWVLERHRALKRHLDSLYRRIDAGAAECIAYDLRCAAELPEPETPAPIQAAPAGQEQIADAAIEALASAPLQEQIEDPAFVAPARVIAFYLPQYHPIPENDRWWGEGFTDWRNVAKAQPLFRDHHQPRLPADLGFYDLRLPETRAAQAALAAQYGIHGFCYYHYWFQGSRLLERPFEEVLRSGEPDFPFCLCWANEPWSRRWDGAESDILQPQAYSSEDDLQHIRWLLAALADRRAITIDGKPLFLVYQAQQLPNPARTTDLWRREVERAGLKGLYLMAVETGWDTGWDATKVGFDAKVLFQPQFSLLSQVPPPAGTGRSRLRVFDYQKAWPLLANPEPVAYKRYDTVFPSWDNSARRGDDAWIVHNSTPEQYQLWLQTVIERAQERPPEERIVFINAWNEWAEGCHLEPDRRHGLAYLEATRRALTTRLRRD